MKTLKESLLDDEEDLIDNQDVIKNRIIQIVDKYFNYCGNITVNTSGKIPIVDIDGDVCLNKEGMELKHFPTEFKFGKCPWMFELSWSKVETLEGCPEIVGNLLCDEMDNLKSLKGSPKVILEDWEITNCKNLKSLDCDTKEIGRNFICSDCKKLPKNSTIKAKVKGQININL